MRHHTANLLGDRVLIHVHGQSVAADRRHRRRGDDKDQTDAPEEGLHVHARARVHHGRHRGGLDRAVQSWS